MSNERSRKFRAGKPAGWAQSQTLFLDDVGQVMLLLPSFFLVVLFFKRRFWGGAF